MTTLQTKETVAETEALIFPHMAHPVNRCARRAETVAWYMRLFQARLEFEDNVLTFITYDDEHHRLAFFNMPDTPPKEGTTAGVHHVAYSYGSIGDLLATYERLEPLEILLFWYINHGATTALYYRDPEGNDIELQSYNGEDPGAYFYTEAFVQKPIGVEFDPDELVRMWKAGASDEELSAVDTAATGKRTLM